LRQKEEEAKKVYEKLREQHEKERKELAAKIDTCYGQPESSCVMS
jgi:iron uptake system EfeUOB component EfeO/EfeM